MKSTIRKDTPALMPFSLVGSVNSDPSKWLKNVSERGDLLRRMRPAIRLTEATYLRSAISWADLALKSLENDDATGAANCAMLAIHFAWLVEISIGARPQLERDRRRQEGTRKDRRPKVSAWIAKQLDGDPRAKTPILWEKAPGWITEQIGERAFGERVTKQRKKRASK